LTKTKLLATVLNSEPQLLKMKLKALHTTRYAVLHFP